MRPKIRILFAGGGTGGHLFPALHIAGYLKENWGADCLFVGTKNSIESRKVPQAGFLIKNIWISGFKRGFYLSNFLFPLKLIVSSMQSRKIIDRFKPELVIGTGGYLSGPVLRQAVKKKIATAIQEQNSYPGMTTRILASKVDLLFLAYEEALKYLNNIKNYKITGNPVRIRHNDVISAFKYFNIQNKKTILVFGGSQGSENINKAISTIIEEGLFNDVEILWQVGEKHFQYYQAKFKSKNNQNIHIYPFIDRMDYAYKVSKLAICRAGAMTIAELAAAGLPAVMIPFPFAAEDHQTKNAQTIADHGGALLIRDDAELTGNLQEAVQKILNHEKMLHKMSDNIKKFHIPDTLEIIGDELQKLLIKKGVIV